MWLPPKTSSITSTSGEMVYDAFPLVYAGPMIFYHIYSRGFSGIHRGKKAAIGWGMINFEVK